MPRLPHFHAHALARALARHNTHAAPGVTCPTHPGSQRETQLGLKPSQGWGHVLDGTGVWAVACKSVDVHTCASTRPHPVPPVPRAHAAAAAQYPLPPRACRMRASRTASCPGCACLFRPHPACRVRSARVCVPGQRNRGAMGVCARVCVREACFCVRAGERGGVSMLRGTLPYDTQKNQLIHTCQGALGLCGCSICTYTLPRIHATMHGDAW